MILFTHNKYHTWYFNIITKAQLRASTREEANSVIGYAELHHITPRSLGGSNSKENLVFLSAREHFICHFLLPKFTHGTDKYKMLAALNGMNRRREYQDRYINSRLYQIAKQNFAKEHSKRLSGVPTGRKDNGLRGHKQTKETVEKRAKHLRGKKRTPEQCLRISEALKNSPNKKTYSDFSAEKQREISAKRSESLKGREKSKEHKQALSKSLKGKTKGIPKSEKTKARMRRPKSESHKSKMRQPKRRVCRIYDRNEMSVNMFTRWIKTLD